MPLIFGRVLASGVMVPVNVDTDGNIQVGVLASLPAGDNNIGNVDVVTLPALPAGTNEIGSIQARSYAWDGAAWRKGPFTWGYSGVVGESLVNLTLAAGTNNLDSAAVPAGQVWFVENVFMQYVGTVATVTMGIDILRGATTYRITSISPPVSGIGYDRQGCWSLAAGDKLRLRILNATLNDDAFLQYSGRYITVNA